MVLTQIKTLIYFILTGISIGILFDIFRIMRKSFKTLDFITYIQDFLFWILTGLILIVSIFIFNNGDLRGYIFIGILFGIFIYMLLLSNIFIKFFITIIECMKKIVGFPIKIMMKFLKKCIINPMNKFLCKIYAKISKIKIKKEKISNKIK